jgi:AcrR family transcriptional regulator
MRLFAEYGYGAVSLETIARQAHVSLRTIYRQFGGKAQVFGAVIRRVSDEFAASLSEAELQRPIEEVLVEFGRRYLYRITRPECIRLRTQILAEAHRFPEFAAEFYRNGPKRTLMRLSEFFSTHQKAGDLIEIDCQFLAAQFLSALRGERFQKLELRLEEPPSQAEIDEWVSKAVRIFLTGCLKSGA